MEISKAVFHIEEVMTQHPKFCYVWQTGEGVSLQRLEGGSERLGLEEILQFHQAGESGGGDWHLTRVYLAKNLAHGNNSQMNSLSHRQTSSSVSPILSTLVKSGCLGSLPFPRPGTKKAKKPHPEPEVRVLVAIHHQHLILKSMMTTVRTNTS